MIEAIHLRKTFGTFQAVRDLSLRVGEGELVALLGPNGAGKTTTVRMLAGILRPTSGKAIIGGYDVAESPEQVRNQVGLLTEFPGLYLRMRPLEYLAFFGELHGVPPATCAQRSEALLKRFELWDARNKRLDAYSKGMKQKMALLRAMIHDPPVLYLDEPTTAMDPHSARVVRDAISELRAAKRTVLLTTHNLVEAEDLADRIVIIFGGQIIAQGTRAELTVQLLGDPVWELQLAAPSASAAALIADMAPVIESGPTWLRFQTRDGQQINPQLIRRLTERDIPVVSLAEVPRSLEDVYLSIVGERHAERGAWNIPAAQPSAPAQEEPSR
ncbi:ABC transporter ATP-binding protein [Chloroflexia bacterium SDU3-3]|nr:ABC transporter ATP-binding protein [Chloroflexia bacterium SDU3-3]